MLPPESRAVRHPSDEPYNVLAVISLVSSLLAWVMVPVLGAIVAVVCGHIARSQLRIAPHEASSIMALLGLVIAYVQLVLLVLGLVAIGVFGWAMFQNGF